MWKFHDFYITQILREINFGESRSSKTAIFAIQGALNFVDLVNFTFQKVQKLIKNQNSEQNGSFRTFVESPKLISRKI